MSLIVGDGMISPQWHGYVMQNRNSDTLLPLSFLFGNSTVTYQNGKKVAGNEIIE